MKAALKIFVFFFTFHAGILMLAVAGLCVLILGTLFGDQAIIGGYLSRAQLIMFGNILIIMPVMWSASVFRQLVSNRRLTMVPGFRRSAFLAFLLVPIVVSGLGILGDAAQHMADSVSFPSESLILPAMTFTLISAFLLTAQWSCTLRRGLLIQLGAFVVVINALAFNVELTMSMAIVGARSFGWPTAALLGWAWLYYTLRQRAVLAAPVPSQSMERLSGSFSDSTGLWQSNFGKPAGPDGTIMLGISDSLANRVWQACIWVLALGTLFVAFNLIVRSPMLGSREAGIGPLFIAFSFMTVGTLAPLAVAEWPARMRFIWLRAGGDRAGFWSRLDRSLLMQSLIVAGVAGAATMLLMATTDTDSDLLLVYAAGCAVALPFGAYLLFWLRIRGLNVNMFSFIFLSVWLMLFWTIFLLYRSFGTPSLIALVIALAALALTCRSLACRQFLAIDWCNVRPVRG